jgi:hypothetical protein
MRKRIWYAAAVAALAVAGTSALTYHVYRHPRSAAAQYARKFSQGLRHASPLSELVPAARKLMAPVHQGIKAEEKLVLAGCDEESLVPDDPVPVEGAVIPLDSHALDEIAPLVIPDATLTPEPCEPTPGVNPAPNPLATTPPAPAPLAMPYCPEEGPPPMPRADEDTKTGPKADPTRKVERIPVMPRCVEEEEDAPEEETETIPGRVRTRQLLRKLHRLYKSYTDHRPVHPEVDTMEFRPSDARLSDFGFGPLF